MVSSLSSYKKYKNKNFFSLYTLRKIMKHNREFRNLSEAVNEKCIVKVLYKLISKY